MDDIGRDEIKYNIANVLRIIYERQRAFTDNKYILKAHKLRLCVECYGSRVSRGVREVVPFPFDLNRLNVVVLFCNFERISQREHPTVAPAVGYHHVLDNREDMWLENINPESGEIVALVQPRSLQVRSRKRWRRFFGYPCNIPARSEGREPSERGKSC